MKKINVAVVGATGLVGGEMIRVLEQRSFPVDNLRAFATSRSAGSTVTFQGREIVVEDIEKADFEGITCALFSGGEVASTVYAPRAVRNGCIVIDNSASFRMDPDVPLVVPEVNPQAIAAHKGIIANPNCSTIQMVVVLKPLHDRAGIERVVVTTFQAVAGTGKAAIDELDDQIRAYVNGEPLTHSIYPHQIAFNVLPQIGDFEESGYTKEEIKMIQETVKIMGDDSIKVTATTVRVPVRIGHAESINIQTREKLSAGDARELLRKAPGVTVADDPGKSLYPLSIECAGRDEVFAGRIREDRSIENGLDMWITADNLRKGAALNAVQIAEYMLSHDMF